jgi:hypothetical protein
MSWSASARWASDVQSSVARTPEPGALQLDRFGIALGTGLDVALAGLADQVRYPQFIPNPRPSSPGTHRWRDDPHDSQNLAVAALKAFRLLAPGLSPDDPALSVGLMSLNIQQPRARRDLLLTQVPEKFLDAMVLLGSQGLHETVKVRYALFCIIDEASLRRACSNRREAKIPRLLSGTQEEVA